MTKNVLIICGAGASSGFLGVAARKAAKKQKENLSFKAKSETEIKDYLNETDVLLVAPHLKYMIDDVKEECENLGVKYGIIPQKVYGSLDGKGLIEVAKKHLQGEE